MISRWRTSAVLVALLGGTTVAAPVASAAVVDTNASYALVNRNSGKALDVYDLATADGTRISQFTRNDGAWQLWQFVDSAAAGTG
ncbi:RICIN domain-containing protein [Lentzea guizhouensis]|uniref:RICIN domain-containing protein n=1 Tax=Lentzea guizhouensis TaxID=1586287 RepID=UPI001F456164|nr:RICIN domain-containing protein [Lentzea guizhouensis]